MTKEVVATRKAFSVRASLNVTVVGDLGRSLLHVLALVTTEVLRVEKPLTADRAPMRPLVTAEMNLVMAAGDRSMKARVLVAGRLTSVHSCDRTSCCNLP